MNKPSLFFFGLLALTVTTGFAVGEKPAEQSTETAPSDETTIATINGKEIPLGLFRLFYRERLRSGKVENTPALQNRTFNEFVSIVVTAQDAEKLGLDKDRRFELALEMQRLHLLSNYAIQNAVKTREPSEEDLKKAYDERYGKDKRIEYKARHILVKTEDEGKKLIEELNAGADFSELAKAHSLGPTGKDGGALPWFGTGQMVQPFIDATKLLKPGEYTSAPVQTQFGWHVILLEETRESDPPALEEVKNELIRLLQKDILEGYVAELSEEADLVFNPDVIKVTEEPEATPADAQ
jgi:peptidyl-prolyl cis-trans isomerase C